VGIAFVLLIVFGSLFVINGKPKSFPESVAGQHFGIKHAATSMVLSRNMLIGN